MVVDSPSAASLTTSGSVSVPTDIATAPVRRVGAAPFDLFRAAVLSLTDSSGGGVSRGQRKVAGSALVEMAEEGLESQLRSILRPHPGEATSTWTVACYQLGDISPSGLRDFSSATEAVKTLRRCETPSHLASELIASSPSGLRWTALVRTGTDVVFQPLDDTSGHGDDEQLAGLLHAGQAAWDQQLKAWADPGWVDPAAVVYVPAPVLVAPPVPPSAPAPATVAPSVPEVSLPVSTEVAVVSLAAPVPAAPAVAAPPAVAASAVIGVPPEVARELMSRLESMESRLVDLHREIAAMRVERRAEPQWTQWLQAGRRYLRFLAGGDA